MVLPRAAWQERLSDVTDVLLFATHHVSDSESSAGSLDAQLFRHYVRQLPPARARLWVLQYRQPLPVPSMLVDMSLSTYIGAGAGVWGDAALARAFPRLADAAVGPAAERSHPGLAQTHMANHRRYFWFSSSILLWNATFGHHYPSLQHTWRIEPDVLFSGSWGDAIARLRGEAADVLLPALVYHSEDPDERYPHWRPNDGFLRDVPERRRVFRGPTRRPVGGPLHGPLAHHWPLNWPQPAGARLHERLRVRAKLGPKIPVPLGPLVCVSASGVHACVLPAYDTTRTHPRAHGTCTHTSPTRHACTYVECAGCGPFRW